VCIPPKTHASLDPPESKSKRHLDRFSRFCTAHGRAFPYFTMGRPFPTQNCPFPWGSGLLSNTWSFRVLNSNGVSIGSAAVAGLTTVTDRLINRPTDRPTDHATPSLTIGRIYRHHYHHVHLLRKQYKRSNIDNNGRDKSDSKALSIVLENRHHRRT